MSTDSIKDAVKQKYGQAALRAREGATACCGTAPAASRRCDAITGNLYSTQEAGELPDAAVRASLGCGNPTALAELKPGETVLDLGSGGGIDVDRSRGLIGAREGQHFVGHIEPVGFPRRSDASCREEDCAPACCRST